MSLKHKAVNCKSNYLCKKCNRRHNIAICQKDLQKPPLGNSQQKTIVSNPPVPNPAAPSSFQNEQVPVAGQQVNTASTYSGNASNNILLQTAKANILNLNQNNTAKSFILFDSGAQRTYITEELKAKLNLVPFKQEKIAIKVFDSTESKVQNIDVVKFIVIGTRKNVYVEALVIPTICSNLYNQYSNSAISNNYPHLKNLKLAQESKETCVKVGILIGLDYYYNFMLGNIIRGKPNEPIALESTLGWIISRPYSFFNSKSVYNINSHFLFVPPSNGRYNIFENETDHKLSMFWDIESVGVNSKELEVYQSFENDLEFTGEKVSSKKSSSKK